MEADVNNAHLRRNHTPRPVAGEQAARGQISSRIGSPSDSKCTGRPE